MHDTLWHTAAQAYLARLGYAEWLTQGSPVPTKRKPHNRFVPSEYMRDLIDCLNRNDENGFKARKMLNGRDTALKV